MCCCASLSSLSVSGGGSGALNVLHDAGISGGGGATEQVVLNSGVQGECP